MIKYGFFNAKRLITGDYDRKYNADDVNTYFKGAMSQDGIYQFVGNQCRVAPNGGMNIVIKDGKGQINYHWFEFLNNEVLPIKAAHSRLNRWTAVIIRYDGANRSMYPLTVDGSPAAKPIKPQIQRNDTIREICLAYIYVEAGVTEITASNIVDTIEDDDLCGFVSTLLHSSQSGVKKVRQLPLPTLDCQGEIYYLTQRNETVGISYNKGYYACEPSAYTYGFAEISYISDSSGSMPTPSVDYADILFNAIDTSKWYRCVEVTADTYEWTEVAVNEVGVLPQADENTFDKFYLVDYELYIGTRTGSDYKWNPIIRDGSWIKELNILTTGWQTKTDSSGNTYYSRTFSLPDLASSDIPIISLKIDNVINISTLNIAKKNYSYLISYECGDGTITFLSTKVPGAAFTVCIMGV